ncbi:hypothetical protein KR009_004591, partial [Drosophila setifemur]
ATAMQVTLRHGAAFFLLYVPLLAALVRPQMNFSIVVDSFFLSADYSATMVLGHRFDTYMAVAAAPLSALTVYALSKWGEEEQLDGLNTQKMIISAVAGVYVIVLVANVLANGIVMQHALMRFDQCPRKAWKMYGEMAMAFVKSMASDVSSIITLKKVHRPRLVYRLH